MLGSRLAVLCLVSLSTASLAQSAISSKLRPRFEQAMTIARTKIESRDCQQLFGDFKDQSGRTLQENLTVLGTTGPDYMALMVFYSGAGMSRCERRETVVTTSPGSRAVFVCERQFGEALQRDTSYAADLIIHEMLHSLGLGENPPSSTAITERVIKRCGR